MGVGYGKTVVQWSKGEYSLANNTQDDTAVMQTYGATLRADDAGDNRAGAVSLTDGSATVSGIISTRADRDFYIFSTGAGPVSFTTASPSVSPDLDVLLSLYDIAGNLVTSSDPTGLPATLGATVPAGTYYIVVEGTAPGNPVTSYNDYGSLGAYDLTGLYQSTAENFVSVVATDPDAAETARFVTPNLGTFTFSRLIVSVQPVTVPFTVSGTAVDGTDFTMPASVTIPAGAPSASITVTPVDDNVGDGSKTVIVTLSPSANYSLGTSKTATVTIRDNELPTVNVAAPVTQVLENSANPITFTLYRDAAAPTPLTVNLLIGGTAVADVDYVAIPTSVTFAAGEDQKQVQLKPKDNVFYNPSMTVTVAVAIDLEYNPGFQSAATFLIVNEELPPDPVKPSVTISSPKAKQRFDAPVTSLNATGTVTDNLAAAQVRYRVNGGNWNVATVAGGSWSADIASAVIPGDNVLEVQAEDDDANVSPILAARFAVVKPRHLEVVISGPGTVTPGSGSFEANQPCVLTAKPQAGKIFAGWTGAFAGSGKSLAFTMPDADLQVTATFVDNPFSEGVIGKYAGLLKGSSAIPETSGLANLTVTKTGLVTGKVVIGGKAFPIKGEFNGIGRLDTFVTVAKQPKLVLGLNLDMNPNGTQSITGTITGAAGVSNIQAFRAPFDTKKNPLPAEFARSYTFYLPAVAPSTASVADTDLSPPIGDDTAPRPQGNGVGVLSISSGGVVKWTGTLGDGSPATQTTLLDGQKRWPLYVSLYKNGGYVAGQVIHNPAAPNDDLSAILDWIKRPNPVETYFPGGFRIEGHTLTGVNYTAPAKGARVLPAYDSAPGNAGPISLLDGNLPDPGLGATLSLLPTNATQIAPITNSLKVSITPKTGAVSGTFVFPITGKVTPIKGVILQGKIGKGIGFFPGSTLYNTSLQTGRVEFSAATP
jgi:uncharacterized repeat protein (TIGR02543 family)